MAAVALAAAGVGLTISACQNFRPAHTPIAVPPPTNPIETGEPEMRVRLVRASELATFESEHELRISFPDQQGIPAITLRSPVEAAIESGSLVFKHASAVHRAPQGAGPAAVSSPAGAPVLLDGVAHTGVMEVHLRGDAQARRIEVIERVPMETYLRGVLVLELYANWSDATYEAQAVAARTYALHERERRMRAGDHFHVENTTQDQAYAGSRTSARADRAVANTRGVALTFRGRILRAYYSSTCGGRAGAARDTWPTGPGFAFNLDAPIQAHERDCACAFSPRHTWSVTRSREETAHRFAAFGRRSGMGIRAISSLASIEVNRRNIAGRPASYSVTDESGRSWTLSAENLRLAFNFTDEGALPDIDMKTRVLSGDIAVRFSGKDVIVEGRGFGHGVGMCQFGAEGMARQGASASDILLHYYPGAAIERAY